MGGAMLSDLRQSSPLKALELSMIKLEAQYGALLHLREKVRKAQRAKCRPLCARPYSPLARRRKTSIRISG